VAEDDQSEIARNDLWNALVGQLRSRLTSLEASGDIEQPSFDEPLRNEFCMTAKSGFLSVWLHTDTGEGSWNSLSHHLDMAESWSMSATGVFEIDGDTMNLFGAAERFLAKVSGLGKYQRQPNE
jgi:hypothetical protein